MATIFAMCSGALPAAISLFRVSGSRSLDVLKTVSGRRIWKPRRMTYTRIVDGAEVLDHAMAVYMPGPHTFTGEDSAEIFVHGSPAVVAAVADRLARVDDVREAHRGEFSRRAFHNGKMDLHEVRGLENLIKSKTETQRRLAFGQMRGGETAVEMRRRMTEVLARVFTILDFGEHVSLELDDVKKMISDIIIDLERMERCALGAEKVQRGLNFVLLGRPNCGKSSILNALANKDVAIVSKSPGTTRDSLEVAVELGGVGCRLTDTAGLRDVADDVELEGIRRAKSKLSAADVVVLVVDPSTSREEFEGLLATFKEHAHAEAKLVLAKNKVDLAGEGMGFPATAGDSGAFNFEKVVETNALSSEGVQPLRSAVAEIAATICPETTFVADHHILRRCVEELRSAVRSVDAAIVCGHLEASLAAIGELTSSSVAEDVLDRIFQSFCIGK